MRKKLNNLVIGPLAFLLVLMPVVCCCVTGKAFAQGPTKDVAVKAHACCDKQVPQKTSHHDTKQCDCPQHSFSKAAGAGSATLETALSQGHSDVFLVCAFAPALFKNDTFSASAFYSIHSPPRFSTPLFIQQHSLRV